MNRCNYTAKDNLNEPAIRNLEFKMRDVFTDSIAFIYKTLIRQQ